MSDDGHPSTTDRTNIVTISTGTHVRLAAGNGPRAFGGAALAALLRAAAAHAPRAARPHSLHAHFLQPANPDTDVELSTRVLRSSRTFTTVAAEATQDGRPVATATASFHRAADSPAHGVTAALPPDSPEAAAPAVGGPLPPESAPARALVDLRDAGTPGATGPDGRPVQRYWVRHRVELLTDADRSAALAWISDLCLTRVADLEHHLSPGRRQAASLDHAMWFHRTPDLAEWLLYEVTSPSYVDELALSTGRFFDRSGRLVASVTQESLLRRR
jgi:acyl-CoA thioesterase-2